MLTHYSQHYLTIISILTLLAVSFSSHCTAGEVTVSAGKFTHIYDPSVGEAEKWYINDHCFIRGEDGLWHHFGITHAEPANPIDEDNFAHATAQMLTQSPWDKQPFALSVAPEKHESHLWAPHVIKHENLYYMYYCAGSDKGNTHYRIHLATSPDLKTWTRHPQNPMVVDGFDARDPFILRDGDRWILYYTATTRPEQGNHIVAARTSTDLVNWSSERHIVFKDTEIGKWGGPCESPFVVRRGDKYYLFIGPRGDYVGTDVFVSDTPLNWIVSDKVGHIDSHAAEVIRDTDGKWFVSHCGWGQGGVYLAELTFNDGLDEADSSQPTPQDKCGQKQPQPTKN